MPQPFGPRAARAGFTLVELLVALVLVNVALLALVGTGAAVVRALDAGLARSAAVLTAQARLERLASLRCSVAQVGGAAAAGGMRETWTVVTSAIGRRLSDSVEFHESGRSVAIVLRTSAPC